MRRRSASHTGGLRSIFGHVHAAAENGFDLARRMSLQKMIVFPLRGERIAAMTDKEQLWPGGPVLYQAEHFRLGTDCVLLADFAGRRHSA